MYVVFKLHNQQSIYVVSRAYMLLQARMCAVFRSAYMLIIKTTYMFVKLHMTSPYMHSKTTHKKPAYTIPKSTYFKCKINFDRLHICSFYDCICSLNKCIYVVINNIYALIIECHIQHMCSYMGIYVLCQTAHMFTITTYRCQHICHLENNMYVDNC